MTEFLRINGVEVSISPANTVANSSLIRVFNSNTGAGVLTIANSTGGNAVSATIAAATAVYVRKNPTDTVNGASMVAVPVKST